MPALLARLIIGSLVIGGLALLFRESSEDSSTKYYHKEKDGDEDGGAYREWIEDQSYYEE